MNLLSQGTDNWIGVSEVYDSAGQFIGNVSDKRIYSPNNDGSVTVDVHIVGTVMLEGQYTIHRESDHHNYNGSTHVGYAEVFDNHLMSTNTYWAQWGLTERSFLMLANDNNVQLAYTMLSRGDHVIYTIISEYYQAESRFNLPAIVGTPYDRHHDPAAGKEEILLHRAGTWSGSLTVLDMNRAPMGKAHYTENVRIRGSELIVSTEGGGFTPIQRSFHMTTNGWQAWTDPGDVVGTYNITGGRALSGYFHYVGAARRIWRREIATHDGKHKAILHFVYKGDERVGIQYGTLTFHKT